MMKTLTHKLFAATAILSLGAVQAAFAAYPCPSDLNCDGQVGAADLGALLGAWGPCAGCRSDLNGDGHVNAADLGALLGSWGGCTFTYNPPVKNQEAEQIGLEMLGAGGPLLLPTADYERIDRDLGLIRAAYPGLASQFHTMAWAPNQLIVKVLIAVPPSEYPCLKTYYGVTDELLIFTSGGGNWYVLTFAGNSNVETLASIFAAAPEVEFAEPNGLFGGENFYTPQNLGDGIWRWTIDDGFWDCFDGCDCHRFYIIDVDAAGAVSLVSYEEFGQSWCRF